MGLDGPVGNCTQNPCLQSKCDSISPQAQSCWQELNLRPLHYKCIALPLSYSSTWDCHESNMDFLVPNQKDCHYPTIPCWMLYSCLYPRSPLLRGGASSHLSSKNRTCIKKATASCFTIKL